MSGTLPGHTSRERHGHLLLLDFDRVAKRNAFDLPMLDDLVATLDEYEADDKSRCALLFAHDEHSTAGLDLANVGETLRQGWKLPEGVINPWDTFGGRCPSKPLMVAVQSYCYIIGIELMLAADINLCVSNARFAQLEVQRGILPLDGATLHMHRVVGWDNAMCWLLTGDEFDTHEAYRLGLAQEVIAPEGLFDHAVALAERVAAQTPLGACATLGSARQTLLEDEAVTAAALPEATRRLLDNEDAREGPRAPQECRLGRLEGR